jgi:uncharacterized protein (DUF433 family)
MPEKKVERQVYEVVPHSKDGWDVKKEGRSRASAHHATKAAAVADARERAKAAPLGQVRLKGRDGRIQNEWTYGKGPRRTWPDRTTERIEINPRVMMGKPVIRGTRIPVELLLRKISEGASEDDLLDAYPRLQRQDIRAAIAYAADTLAHEETIFFLLRLRPLADPCRSFSLTRAATSQWFGHYARPSTMSSRSQKSHPG